MKKMILFIILLIISVEIKATEFDTYYSDYGEYSDFSDQIIIGNELIDVDIERRYRWYRENKVGDYLNSDKEKIKYSYEDDNNYKYTDYSEWSFDEVLYKDGREVESQKVYNYQKLKPINQILITDLVAKTANVSFSNLKIYNGDELITYTKQYWDSDILSNIDGYGALWIYLDDFYYMDDLSIKLTNEMNENIVSMSIYAMAPDQQQDVNLVYCYYDYLNDKSGFIKGINFSIRNPHYEDLYTYNNLDEIEKIGVFDLVEAVTKYRYRDKLFYFYNLEKEYAEGYHVNYGNYIKDSSQYIDLYRSRLRHKISVDNQIIISSYNMKLEDFVDSTVDYTIETNIDYLKNGTYFVKYITDFVVIEKDVEVYIEDNILRDNLANDDIYKQNNENNYQKKANEYDFFYKDFKLIEDELYDINNKSSVEQNKCNTDTNKLNNQNSGYENRDNSVITNNLYRSQSLNLGSNSNDYLQKPSSDINTSKNYKVGKKNIIIFLILILVLLIIIIMKKMSYKNKF